MSTSIRSTISSKRRDQLTTLKDSNFTRTVASGGGEPVKVSFKIRYGDGLSPNEKDPQVFIYFSSQIEQVGKDLEIDLPLDDAELRIPVTLEGRYDCRKSLPTDTKIMFYVTSETPNDFDAGCRVDAGLGEIALCDLIKGTHFNKDIPLRLISCGGFVKGIIGIESIRRDVQIDSRIRWELDPISANLERAPKSSLDVLLDVEMDIMGYIGAVIKTEQSFPNTFEGTSNVRIPIYYGDVGMMRKRAPLPAAAFFLAKTPKSNRLFWTNALDTVMARDGQSVNDIDRMCLTEQARVMADVVCMLVQVLDYKSDTIDKNRRFVHASPGFIDAPIARETYDPTKVEACERFGDALRDKNGDCEDLCLAIAQVFSSFNQADFKGHKQLTRLQEIASQYIAWMTLDVVTSAAVKSDDDKSTAASHARKFGAHLKCNFLPAHYVQTQMEKATRDMAAIRANTPNEEIAAFIGSAIETSKGLPFKPMTSWAKDLPVVIGEGTGMFQTLGVEVDPIQAERAEVYRGMPSLMFAKKAIVHKPGSESSFFVGSMCGFTSYWFEQGCKVGGAWFGYSGSANVSNPGQFQRGVHFKHIVNKSDTISILPHPEFSDTQMDWMRRATQIRVPPRDLILTEAGIAAQPEHNETLDSLCEYTASMNRKQLVQQPPVPVYVQKHQLVQNVVNGVKRDIQKNRNITGMSYVCEHMTDWLHTYRVGISANTSE